MFTLLFLPQGVDYSLQRLFLYYCCLAIIQPADKCCKMTFLYFSCSLKTPPGAMENSFRCVALKCSVQSSRYFVVEAFADHVLRLLKMKCGLIFYAQAMQLKWLAASGYRDVTLLPISFTVNNQEATPRYCIHNCDCICGQAKSKTENSLETQCPMLRKACSLAFGTFQPIAPGLMTSPSPVQVYH